MVEHKSYAGRWVVLNQAQTITGTGDTPAEARAQAESLGATTTGAVFWVSPHPPYLLLPEWPIQILKQIFEGKDIWLAGGAVRDLLLHRPLHDWDFAVRGNATKLARKVADALHGAYVTLDDERDTGRAIVNCPLTHTPITLDFAALREGSIEEDLRKRDFTVNAIALTLEGKLIDPTGGQEDLQNGIIRATSDESFQQDPARLLRAPRMSGTLGFQISPPTRSLIQEQAPNIRMVSAERIQAELLHILALSPAAPTIQLAEDLGLLPQVIPEVSALEQVEQSWPHYLSSAFDHTLSAITALEKLLQKPKINSPAAIPPAPDWCWTALSKMLSPFQSSLQAYLRVPLAAEMPRDDLLKWGLLFHDIGKARTRTIDEVQHIHFYGHAEKGSTLTQERLSALRFPNQAISFIVTLVNAHMRLISLSKSPPTRRTIYRFYRDTGDAGVGVVLIALADALAVWGPALSRDHWECQLETAAALLEAYFAHKEEVVTPPPLLTGHDLIALGIEPGPEMGKLLAQLREAQAAGEIKTREQAETFIQLAIKGDQP